MDCLVRFAQTLESFRKAEIEALATLIGINVEFLAYAEDSPYCIVRLQDETAARALISRSVLAKGIYELWGEGDNYDELHRDLRRRTESRWPDFLTPSFKFEYDGFRGKRSSKEKVALIQSFAYLGFQGPIKMVGPDEEFCIFEEYDAPIVDGSRPPVRGPLKRVYLGRWLAKGSREAVDLHDLKKRNYISTTSMDAGLSLVTANMALASEGKVFYDPFVGTGSFCVAAAHFGAHTYGSDIDGRSFRGKERGKGKPIGLVENLQQYQLESRFMDAFISDLTNSPLRKVSLFDGIMCDPPYGVREGLKVLGTRDGQKKEVVFIDGVPTHYMEGYVPPRRQYSFEAILNDLLEFAAETLVPNGRLSFWMPTANEDYEELDIPSNPYMELVSVCVQPFNKWSRRLLTYRRLPDNEVSVTEIVRRKREVLHGTADDLNSFRKKYFTKLASAEAASGNGRK